MKKLILFGFLFFLVQGLKAAPPVAEAPIKSPSTPATIAVSSTTLTKVPTTQNSGRMGLFFDNPATNTGRMVGFFGDCTSTSVASTIRPIEIAPGTNTLFFPAREDVCLWLIDLNTAAASENCHIQEVTQ